MIQRFLALLLALVICVSIPVTGFAAEVEESIEPTEQTTEPTEVTEEVETTDYMTSLQNILVYLNACTNYLQVVTGCVVFQIVVVLCFFAYKFFRIFF